MLQKRLLCFLFSVLVFGCKDKTERPLLKNKTLGNALGTTYAVTYLDIEERDFSKSIDSVFAVFNKSLSTYIPDSDISKINRGDTTVVVDQMFRDVFFQSQVINYETNGYFDPTVGVLVEAWGFGAGQPLKTLTPAKIDSLMQYVGWIKIGLTRDYHIEKANPNVRFDFNAIAKGYAIDRIARMLDGRGIENYLVEVGGEIVAKGSNLITKKPWTVGIDDPLNLENRGSAAIVQLKDRALASSGNYRKFRIDGETGEKYVHTINPKTGYTKNSKVLAVTVIADYCIQADGYATAFMAMDLEDTKALLKLKEQDLEAFIIYLDDQGGTQKFITKGFEELLRP